jgi:hypothetical protein
MRKTLEIKGFSLYQPFGWVMAKMVSFNTNAPISKMGAKHLYVLNIT